VEVLAGHARLPAEVIGAGSLFVETRLAFEVPPVGCGELLNQRPRCRGYGRRATCLRAGPARRRRTLIELQRTDRASDLRRPIATGYAHSGR